jgi:hypothetical protein
MHTTEPTQISKDEKIVKLLTEWLETIEEKEAALELARVNFKMECG